MSTISPEHICGWASTAHMDFGEALLATWRIVVVYDGVGLSIGADEALIVVDGLRFFKED
jgi:hypothetical protein